MWTTSRSTPPRYPMEASRRHRWTRGDWQLAGWLLPRVPGPGGKRQPNPLALLSIWKLWDNLRRSLVPAALVALCVGGWLFAVGPSWLWPLLTVGALFLPSLVTAALELGAKTRRARVVAARGPYRQVTGPAAPARAAWADAVAVRCAGLSQRHPALGLQHARHPARVAGLVPPLLRPAERAAQPGEFFGEMWIAPRPGRGAGSGTDRGARTRLADWWFVVPLLVLWLVAPRPPVDRQVLEAGRGGAERSSADVSARCRRQDLAVLRRFRRPWDNWLPLDNYQEHPSSMVASRTSPTNMGMALFKNLVAHDFGYVSTGELLRRTERTLRTHGEARTLPRSLTTGTTPARLRRSTPSTSLRSTAATSPPAC